MFVYHGTFEPLIDEIGMYRARVEAACRDILGDQAFGELEGAERRFLCPESFYETCRREFMITGEGPGFGVRSRLVVGDDHKAPVTGGTPIYPEGLEIHTAPHFFLPVTAFPSVETPALPESFACTCTSIPTSGLMPCRRILLSYPWRSLA